MSTSPRRPTDKSSVVTFRACRTEFAQRTDNGVDVFGNTRLVDECLGCRDTGNHALNVTVVRRLGRTSSISK